MTIQLRGDTAANWTAANPTLAARQPGYETDTGRIKVGNGSTAWNSLPYRFEASGGVSDGDKGDIIVSGLGTVWTIENNSVTSAKILSVAWGKLTGIPAAISGTTAAFTTAQETKLSGIAVGATVNDTDAALRDRSTHTGSQPASSINDFAEAVDDRVAALLVAGDGVSISYNDVGNTLTISSSTPPKTKFGLPLAMRRSLHF